MKNYRHTDSTGVQPFSTTITSKVDIPVDEFVPERVEMHRIEVANNSGQVATVGWGYSVPQAQLQVGNYVAAADAFTDMTDLLAVGSITVGSGIGSDNGSILIASQHKLNSVQLNIVTAGGARAAGKYFKGSFASLTPITAADTEATALQVETFLLPLDARRVTASDTLATLGVDVGSYVYIIEVASEMVVSAVEGVVLMNVITNVPTGSTLVDDKVNVIPRGCSVVPYITEANAANTVSVEFSKA